MKLSNFEMATFVVGSLIISYSLYKASKINKEFSLVLALFSIGLMIRGMTPERAQKVKNTFI